MDGDPLGAAGKPAGTPDREPTRPRAGRPGPTREDKAPRRPKAASPAVSRPAPAGGGRAGLGRLGERLAAAHLERLGYQVRERNHRSRYGEIDVVAERDTWLVFVEVRTRRGVSFGDPIETLTPRKQARLRATALDYCRQLWEEGAAAELNWRIDLIAVRFDDRGRLIELEHVENAVTD